MTIERSDEMVEAHDVHNLRQREKELKKKKIYNNIKLFFSNKRAVFGVFLLGLFIALAVLGPIFYEYDHFKYFLGPRIGMPTEEFKLGFDEMGRDVLGTVIYATRASLAIGILVTLIVV